MPTVLRAAQLGRGANSIFVLGAAPALEIPDELMELADVITVISEEATCCRVWTSAIENRHSRPRTRAPRVSPSLLPKDNRSRRHASRDTQQRRSPRRCWVHTPHYHVARPLTHC